MANKTKELIVEKSYMLFREKGYSATSMREIADAVGITVGNLCYHFPKKEDLYYTFYSRLFPILSESLNPLLSKKSNLWVGYLAKEYLIMYKFFMDPVYVKQFLEAIELKTLRQRYCHDHYSRFIDQISGLYPNVSNEEVFEYSIVVCSAELHLFEAHAGEDEEALQNIFLLIMKVQMNLLQVDEKEQKKVAGEVFDIAKRYLAEHPSFMSY